MSWSRILKILSDRDSFRIWALSPNSFLTFKQRDWPSLGIAKFILKTPGQVIGLTSKKHKKNNKNQCSQLTGNDCKIEILQWRQKHKQNVARLLVLSYDSRLFCFFYIITIAYPLPDQKLEYWYLFCTFIDKKHWLLQIYFLLRYINQTLHCKPV